MYFDTAENKGDLKGTGKHDGMQTKSQKSCFVRRVCCGNSFEWGATR